MRFKDIAILVCAGILSLAAVLILEQEGASPRVDTSTDGHVGLVDNSSLVAYSAPLPTAEPPVADDSATATPQNDAKPTVPESPQPLLAENNPAPTAAPTDANKPAKAASGAISPPSSLISDPVMDAPDDAISMSYKEGTAPFLSQMPSTGDTTSTSDDSTEQPSIIEETPGGFWLKSAKLNDVFQHLAQLGGFQYFHNVEVEGPNFVVTGQLMKGDPYEQMEELAVMYGLTIHKKGNTVYALNSAQLSQLPTEPFRYQLRYLRPKDIDQIKLILQPFLTPGSGIIEFESKTNTLIMMDNARKLDALAIFLDQIDQPKQQIAIETRILRVTSSSSNRIGVDWSSVLGENGTTISAATSLNALFNLPDLATAASFITMDNDGSGLTNHSTSAEGAFRNQGEEGGSGSLVLSPLQLTAVLRALNAGGLAQQESSPTLIAEDNEEGLISIIDRIPIVTSTVTVSNGTQNVADEVRYKIDEEDAAGDPATTREVGVSVSVTPTILPDNTIRMALRPRSAQVTEYISTPSGNLYPRVNESTVTTTARVPNGHSLLIGGFYEESITDSTNKVPILGDIPAVNLLFKSSTKERKNTSLVFIVTPKLYRPEIPSQNDLTSHEIHEAHILPTKHSFPDPDKPKSNYKPKLRNSARAAANRPPSDPPSSILLPEHPYNRPVATPIYGAGYDDNSQFVAAGDRPEVTVRPSSQKKGNGLFNRMFGGSKK